MAVRILALTLNEVRKHGSALSRGVTLSDISKRLTFVCSVKLKLQGGHIRSRHTSYKILLHIGYTSLEMS